MDCTLSNQYKSPPKKKKTPETSALESPNSFEATAVGMSLFRNILCVAKMFYLNCGKSQIWVVILERGCCNHKLVFLKNCLPLFPLMIKISSFGSIALFQTCRLFMRMWKRTLQMFEMK